MYKYIFKQSKETPNTKKGWREQSPFGSKRYIVNNCQICYKWCYFYICFVKVGAKKNSFVPSKVHFKIKIIL